jgi:hypothetical protein
LSPAAIVEPFAPPVLLYGYVLRSRSRKLPLEKLPDEWNHFVSLVLESEMTGVDQM